MLSAGPFFLAVSATLRDARRGFRLTDLRRRRRIARTPPSARLNPQDATLKAMYSDGIIVSAHRYEEASDEAIGATSISDSTGGINDGTLMNGAQIVPSDAPLSP